MTGVSHTCSHCRCLGCPLRQSELGAIIKLSPEITYNKNRTDRNGKKAPDGIELRFGSTRPTAEVREMLKKHGFKFSEKQTIWYARDNANARELIAFLEANEIDADDTQYEKRNFWAKIKSLAFYNKLTNYTEFMIVGTPPRFFKTKKQLENAVNPKEYLFSDKLRFKKFYNKIVGEEEGEEGEESQDEQNEEDVDSDNETEQEESEQEEQETDNPIRDFTLADKLESLAEGMQKQIEAKLNSATSRQRPTAKRLRVAAGMREEGYYLKNIQVVLSALAQVYRKGNINNYPLLKNIRTKSQVELLNKYNDLRGDQRENHYLQSVFNNNAQTFKQLGISSVFNWSMAIGQKTELLEHFPPSGAYQRNEQQEKIEQMEMKIKAMKIPGFFPTPKNLIDEILDLADIKSGQSILEPSAGKGDILDVIKQRHNDTVDLYACEINSTLRELLNLKGYEVLGSDFLTIEQKFDRIIMNPPFESGQDALHVTHALKLLNKGGRLVAIMGEGVFFRQFAKDKEFRELLMDQNAYVSEPIKEAFKNAFNQTGITVRIVVMNRDGTLPEFEDEFAEEEAELEEEYRRSQEELETLELEAQAEIELLKMKLELEKKRRGLNGLSGLEKNPNQFPDVWNFN